MDASNGNGLPPREIIVLPRGKKDIRFPAAVIVVPMVILTAVLLGRIIHNQVPQTYSALPGVPDPLARESSACLVDFSVTRLLILASWTSTVVSPAFVRNGASIVSCCRTILNEYKEKNTHDLPTPYQLRMLLGVLSGSIGLLWNRFQYWGWKEREWVHGVAKGSIAWLVFVAVLGYLIVIADIWLHATASTVQLLQALPGPYSVLTFGRGFYSREWKEYYAKIDGDIKARRYSQLAPAFLLTLLPNVEKLKLRRHPRIRTLASVPLKQLISSVVVSMRSGSPTISDAPHVLERSGTRTQPKKKMAPRTRISANSSRQSGERQGVTSSRYLSLSANYVAR